MAQHRVCLVGCTVKHLDFSQYLLNLQGKEECGSTGSVLWVVLQTFSQYFLNLQEEGRVWQHRVCLVNCTAGI